MRTPIFCALHLRTLVLSFAIPFLAAAWWWALPHLVAMAPVTAQTQAVAGKVVVIDPGHGGVDPGAVGRSGILEKDVVLQVAHALAPLLQRASVHTLLVREGDEHLAAPGAPRTSSRQRADLSARVDMANRAGADLYISLHANSMPNSRWSGAQTFYYPGKDDSRRLAEAIQARLGQAFPENKRRALPGEYYVLQHTRMPAVVVEIGFLSNPEEERLLATAEHQRRIAAAIFWGIVDYFTQSAESVRASRARVAAVTAQPAGDGARAPLVAASVPADGDTYLAYFLAESDGGLALRAVPTPLPERAAGPVERIGLAVEALASPPSAAGSLYAPLPPFTRVLDVSLEDGLLRLDLSREVRTRFAGGSQSEALLVESIVLTAGQFPGVREVMLTIEGQVETTLAGHVDISRPFRIVQTPAGP